MLNFIIKVVIVSIAAMIILKNIEIKVEHSGKLETQNSHHGPGRTPIQISNR
jgi:hypothetical protein